MANRLTGKIVLVTGAASGLGEAQARVFAREGAKVMLADISTAGADAAAKIRDEGGSADFVQLDVSKLESWKDAVSAAVQTFGGLTSLSNTAGIIHYAGVEEETMDGWNRIISVNQTGVLLGMQAALPELVKSGNGAIVNVSSLIALIAAPGSISYGATKSAVRMMSRIAAMEYVKKGVRVNTIVPGPMRTPITADVPPDILEADIAKIPMGSPGDPEDIAYAAVYLLSNESKYVTGAELVVDGGWSVSA
ncbi:SDR family oxidoreductase [Sphingopyxis indica]|uniref:SDR family NAD(P)-dependent oxidoreductase n=1 Tax=Sphingopyxis indica TaxID=436663 RepID=UPI002938FF0B|nr:SDR family oxidoreductase [Sphingopyxis indica]WOF43293.1 SDR family oxidoreductase [Sphingopyxis indica]